MSYTIGEMSKLLGVPASTIRFYDSRGLLPFVERSAGGRRVFSEKDLRSLRLVECLKRSGMSIEEIQSFISMVLRGDGTIDARLSMFERRKSEVEKQMADLRGVLSVIEYKCWYYAQAKSAGTTAALENLTADDVPPQHRATYEALSGKKQSTP